MSNKDDASNDLLDGSLENRERSSWADKIKPPIKVSRTHEGSEKDSGWSR